MTLKRYSLFNVAVVLCVGIIACGKKEEPSFTSSNFDNKRISFERLMYELEIALIPVDHFGFISSENAHYLSLHLDSKTSEFRNKSGISSISSSTLIPGQFISGADQGPVEFRIEHSRIREIPGFKDVFEIFNDHDITGSAKITGDISTPKIALELSLNFHFFEHLPRKGNQPTGTSQSFDLEFKAQYTLEGPQGGREIIQPSCSLKGVELAPEQCLRYLKQINT